MKQRGGKRAGAGRKSNAQKLIEGGFVAPWFTQEFQEIKWRALVNSDDENVSLKAMCYLSDRLFGKAKQEVEHSGKDGAPIPISVTVDL